jgi:hypothetical protein
MRNIKTLLCVVALVGTTHGGGTLLAAPTPQVIVLGELVHGTFLSDGPNLPFELTVPSDGWVAVSLNWDAKQGALVLVHGNNAAYSDLGGTIRVVVWMVAGQTLSLGVGGPSPWDYGQAHIIPFVLTTIESGPPPPPPPCATPDPFTSLGGGTCFNGDWWPPGLTPPGVNPSPPPPPPPPPPSSGGCTTPDPFVSLGGGTCFNGGWWPPGLTPPGVNPNPAPAPAPPAPPPSPSPPTSGTCVTPDPFVALGGGTCSNGDWWPPGLTPPGVNPNPPPPLPPPSPGGCTTPDPFVSLGGGTCFNGGWWPPGLLPPISVLIR